MAPKTRILREFFLVAILLCITTGCIPAVDISGNSWLPATDQTGQHIAIGEINIKRPAARGGDDVSAIGRIRGGFGNPFTVKAKKGKELDAVMLATADNALQNAGFSIATADTPDTDPRMEIDVLDFWCDGYWGYNVKATIEVRLIKSGRVVASKTIEKSQGFFLNMGYSPMHDAYRKITSQLTTEISTFLQSDEVRQALPVAAG